MQLCRQESLHTTKPRVSSSFALSPTCNRTQTHGRCPSSKPHLRLTLLLLTDVQIRTPRINSSILDWANLAFAILHDNPAPSPLVAIPFLPVEVLRLCEIPSGSSLLKVVCCSIGSHATYGSRTACHTPFSSCCHPRFLIMKPKILDPQPMRPS
ncbi:hypothetical protein MANES_07G087825v8 [Manihot esculenta]|uniref:Uncharacterized protein n=1 Tax=Manihot esculenta TaxID=3983 RepID=A0ACB7HED0_MANES|nr:hypothetical protein MANES_07G087825v8 [Manihot esculenta]